jgi:hypothetical protein
VYALTRPSAHSLRIFSLRIALKGPAGVAIASAPALSQGAFEIPPSLQKARSRGFLEDEDLRRGRRLAEHNRSHDAI